ncbi:hypothetical protein WJX79_003727 [Trebouxia sp. C0005]
MQRGLAEESMADDAWGFGGVDLETLQAELAEARLQQEALLQQAVNAPIPLEKCDASVDPDRVYGNTVGGTLQPFQGGSLPPKAPGLKDRYFNSTPTASFTNGNQGSNHVLKLQREGIVSAYTDFQQRRGSITSMHITPAAGTCSPSSSLRRGYLTASSQGSFQQPLLHLPSHLDSPGRNVPVSSRFMDSKKSFAAPVSRTSSSAAPYRQSNLEQPLASRNGTAACPVSCDFSVLPHQLDGILHADSALPSGQSTAEQITPPSLPFVGTSRHADNGQSWQHDTASIALHSQQLAGFASVVSDTSPASSMAHWHIPDVQPEPEALCIWAAEDSQQSAQDTTGEMVRAMSAQKKDLTRRLKAAESSNRQLRSELQDFRAGQRWGATPGPLPTDRSPSAATGRPSSNIRSSWQEMAAVLDMLQDISVPSERSQPGRPASASHKHHME